VGERLRLPKSAEEIEATRRAAVSIDGGIRGGYRRSRVSDAEVAGAIVPGLYHDGSDTVC
jgi:hypothetical protein